jgi:hypothetical protein
VAQNAVTLIVNGFCEQVVRELPMEFALRCFWVRVSQPASVSLIKMSDGGAYDFIKNI